METFPTHEVNEIILKFCGSDVSPALCISVTVLLDQLSGGSPSINILVKTVARTWWVAGSLRRMPYIIPSGPGAEVGFLLWRTVIF